MRLPLYSLSDGKSAILHLNCAPQIIVIAIITTMYDLHKLIKDQTKNSGDFNCPDSHESKNNLKLLISTLIDNFFRKFLA